MPALTKVWKKFWITMRTVSCQNDQNKRYGNYWEDTAPVDWSKEVTFKVPTKQRWPSHRKLVTDTVTPAVAKTPGKCPAKLVDTSGKKYSIQGEFSSDHTGPGIDGELANYPVHYI